MFREILLHHYTITSQRLARRCQGRALRWCPASPPGCQPGCVPADPADPAPHSPELPWFPKLVGPASVWISWQSRWGIPSPVFFPPAGARDTVSLPFRSLKSLPVPTKPSTVPSTRWTLLSPAQRHRCTSTRSAMFRLAPSRHLCRALATAMSALTRGSEGQI